MSRNHRGRAALLGASVLAGLIVVGVGANAVTPIDVSHRTSWSSFWRAARAPKHPATTAAAVAASPSDSPTPTPTQTPSGSPTPSNSSIALSATPSTADSSTSPSTTASSQPSPTAATGTPTAATGTPTAATGTPAQQVLDRINQARATAGVVALTMSAPLVASAHAHNLVMAGGCGLSHQCTGEADFGARISAQGVTWSAAAENIGEGGPVTSDEAAQASMAVELTDSMLAETAPNDGHRKNILNPALHHIGVDVIRDADGTVWLTQDFTN